MTENRRTPPRSAAATRWSEAGGITPKEPPANEEPIFDTLVHGRGSLVMGDDGVVKPPLAWTAVECKATPDLGWVPDQAPTPWWRRVLKKVRGEVTGD